MPETGLAKAMLQDLIEKYPTDFDGARQKIEKWKQVMSDLENFVEMARSHPDGWEHVMKTIEESGQGEKGKGKGKYPTRNNGIPKSGSEPPR